MFKTSAALLLMSTALAAGPAFAQSTTTTPSSPAPMSTTAPATAPMGMASGGVVSQQGTGEFRASKFMGLDIYGSENQKVGDIKEILIDGNGQAKAVVIGVGGFLGIGEKNVAVAWSAVEWKLDRAVTTASTSTGSTTPATTTPMSSSAGGAPATTASTAPARSPAEQAAYNGYPDHGMIKMTKADLQNAATYKYYSDTTSASGTTTTNAPARQ